MSTNEPPARESVDVERLARELFRAWCGPNAHLDSANLDNTPSLIGCWQRIARRAIELLAPPRDSSPAASVNVERLVRDYYADVVKWSGDFADKRPRDAMQLAAMTKALASQGIVARDSSAASPAASGAFVEAADAIRNAFRHEKSCGVRGGFKCDCTGMEMLNAYDRARLEMQTPTARDSSAAESGRAQPRVEFAPPHTLPLWGECQLRVHNSEFLAKRVAEGGYGAECDSKTATELHRFIYEYDDADPLRSSWFMHRLEKMLEEERAIARAAPPTPAAPEAKADEHGWLAEHGQLYWCGRGNGFGAWTVRVRAVRFARKEDAEAVLADYKCIGRAVRFEDAKVAPAWEAPISTDEGEPPYYAEPHQGDMWCLRGRRGAFAVFVHGRPAMQMILDELNRRAPAPEAERHVVKYTLRWAVNAGLEIVPILSDASDGESTTVSWDTILKHAAVAGRVPLPTDARLRDLLRTVEELIRYVERNECQHEDTYRGGSIWTICRECGRKWADDQGGFKPYEEPKEISAARSALLALARGEVKS